MDNYILENVRIGFRNFSGKAGKYNAEGKRNFVVFLDDETAEDLAAKGWNVKQLAPRDPEDEPTPYLQVSLNYGYYPPRITVISNGHKVNLDEDSVDTLDWAEIASVDLIVRPYEWEVNGTKGVKAYAKTMYVILEDDPFVEKYWEPEDGNDERHI